MTNPPPPQQLHQLENFHLWKIVFNSKSAVAIYPLRIDCHMLYININYELDLIYKINMKLRLHVVTDTMFVLLNLTKR